MPTDDKASDSGAYEFLSSQNVGYMKGIKLALEFLAIVGNLSVSKAEPEKKLDTLVQLLDWAFEEQVSKARSRFGEEATEAAYERIQKERDF